ncbi:MAG: SDR family NAD(P)-dependent oxidoreductase [Candidatus Marinimicrobia bacterium]|nr:SDR family NAD(P)-dependent oxidoreductase [Candidatus Neomarinimicrobiota bacterium]
MTKPVAWVTGATSGIGAAFAEYFASQGYDLVLTGRREGQLREFADVLGKKYGASSRLFFGELSEESVISKIERELQNDKLVHVLVNNAGFASYGSFHEGDLNVYQQMIKVHCEVPVRLSYAALKTMVDAKKGILINVASLAGFFPYPNHTLYSATKTFLINFSESLGVRYKNDGIHIVAVCPGMTMTNFHTRMGLDARKVYKIIGLEKALTPEQVVKNTISCINHRKYVCIPGFHNRFLRTGSRMIPRKLLYKIMSTWIEKRRTNPSLKSQEF